MLPTATPLGVRRAAVVPGLSNNGRFASGAAPACIACTRAARTQSATARHTRQSSSRSVIAKSEMESQAAEAGDKPRVALLGVGLMGNKMARRLQESGFPVAAWNRSAEAAAPLKEVGVTVADTAAAAIEASDVVILVLADADAIKEVILSDTAGPTLAGKTIVQMGTIGPDQSREIAAAVEKLGGEYLEAPVLGSQPEAAAGTLLIMIGCKGEPSASPAWPVITSLGPAPIHIGEVGSGAAVKLALNQLIASLTVGFSTSLALLQRNNVDVSKFMDILRPSALYAPTFDKKLGRMTDREYSNPNFPTKHLLKDVKLFAQEAAAANLDVSLLQGLEKVIQSTVDRGLDFTDYSAVHEGVLNESLDDK